MKHFFGLGLIALLGCSQAPMSQAVETPAAPAEVSPAPQADETPAGKNTNPFLVGYNEVIPMHLIGSGHSDDAADFAISRSEKAVQMLLNVPQGTRTFTNTLLPLDDIITDLSDVIYPQYLMANVHPDETIRTETDAAVLRVENYMVDLAANEDIYNAVVAFSKTAEAAALTGEKKKFLDDTLLDFKRTGFGLEKEKRDKVTALQKQLSKLGQAWSQNINTYRDTLFVTEEEIFGLPDAYKKERLQTDGTYAIDMTYPSYRPFMRLSDSNDARRRLQLKYQVRAQKGNLTVLDSLIMTRTAIATTLGYATFSEYQTETRMVKTPQVVWDFETDLTARLKEKAQAEYDELLAIKTEETGKEANTIFYWEGGYYLNKLKIQKFNVDGEIIKQYFEIGNVTEGLFTIYQKLLNITFKQIEDPSVWFEDVTMYNVYDNDSGNHLGQFYLDMYPRAAKYGHAAMFSIRKGKRLADGSYIRPVSSLVCNFPKPSEFSPSLLTHDQVETFFHEFGHLMHGILTTAEMYSFSGTSVPRDFVEAPSQMLENWTWEKESLSLFAKHFETGEPFPDELLENMLKAKNVSSGIATLQQVFYGTLDMTLYDGFDPEGEKTTTDVVRELQNSITLYPYTEGTTMQTSFGHLNGYASSYYGYLWSLVIAQDLFSKFEEEGIMSQERGAKYRNLILAPGGSKEPMELIEDYLGRKPNNAAFLRSLGLE